MRSELGLDVVGMRRGKSVIGRGLLDERLKIGDTLLLVGFWSDIRQLQSDPEDIVLLNLPVEFSEALPASRRAPLALATLGLVVALMISGIVPNVQAALIGCLLMGLFGCVDFDSGYRSISWKSLILIVGMLPFSLALQRTGGVDLAANAMIGLVGGRIAAGGAGRHFRRDVGAGTVHLEYRDGGADGAGRARHRQGSGRCALSVCDGGRHRRVRSLHDADLVAGEHAGRRSRAI